MQRAVSSSCFLFLGLLVGGSSIVSCKTQRTVTEGKREAGSSLYENTMGFELGDFSKRSHFETLRDEDQQGSYPVKSFGTSSSRLQKERFAAGDSDMGAKLFDARKKGGADGLDRVSSYQERRADRVSGSYGGASEEFGTSAVSERFTKSAGYGGSRYDSAPGRLVEGWQADSLPPRVIQTPDSDEDLSSLKSIDSLRRTLGK